MALEEKAALTDHDLYNVKYDLLPREVEHELAVRWRDKRDLKARARIVEAYQRMAVSYAMRTAKQGLSFEDLLQEANLGLIAALDRFDPERNFGFGTYARYQIISKVQIYKLENAGAVRIFNTATTKTLLSKYNRLRQAIEAETGRPLDEEGRMTIADILGIDRKEIDDFERAVSPTVQIDAGAGQSGDEVIKPLQIVNPEDLPEEQALTKIAQEQIRKLLDEGVASLSDREAEIVRARLMDDEESTLEDLSQRFKISRERVRQIELRAKKNLARFLRKRGIRSADAIFGR